MLASRQPAARSRSPHACPAAHPHQTLAALRCCRRTPPAAAQRGSPPLATSCTQPPPTSQSWRLTAPAARRRRGKRTPTTPPSTGWPAPGPRGWPLVRRPALPGVGVGVGVGWGSGGEGGLPCHLCGSRGWGWQGCACLAGAGAVMHRYVVVAQSIGCYYVCPMAGFRRECCRR